MKGNWVELIDVMISAGAKPYPKTSDEKDATLAIISKVCTPSDAARFSNLLEQKRKSGRFGKFGFFKPLQQLKGRSS